MGTRILVIDDDVELLDLLKDYLAPEGFEVETADRPEAGLELALSGRHDLVVLDVMLPGMSGFDVLRKLRVRSSIPVLMLTARGDDVDRIVGLEMGADDYLAKPFNPRELVARIRAIRRRSEVTTSGDTACDEGERLVVGDLELDPGSRSVRRGGEVLELTSTEIDVLAALLAAAGRLVDRDEISRQALGRRFSPYDRSIDVHISNLRRKLGPLPGGEERIKTIRGSGYLYVRENQPRAEP